MSSLKVLRSLGIYLIIFLIVSASFHFLLKQYFNYSYSPEGVEKLLSSVSTYKFYSDDPCSNAISGDPVDSGLKYVKVNIHCDRLRTTTNSLDLRAVRPATPKGVLQLVANVNGFRIEISDNQVMSMGGLKTTDAGGWRCITDGMEIKDFNSALREQQSVNCFYNFDDNSIKQYLEKH